MAILRIKDPITGEWQEIPVLQGNDGKSAYEIAVDNGFVGTEEEWLESLKGTDGSGSSVEVIDNLESTSATAALSANQGRLLNEMIGSMSTMIDEINGEEVGGGMIPVSSIEITYPSSMYVSDVGYNLLLRATNPHNTPFQLGVIVTPAEANVKTITWALRDDARSLTIDQTGLLSCHYNDGGHGTVDVRVEDMSGNIINKVVEISIDAD